MRPRPVVAAVAADRPSSRSHMSLSRTSTVNADGPVQVTEMCSTRASSIAEPK